MADTLPVSQRALDCAADVSGCGKATKADIRAGKLNTMPVVRRTAAFERDCTAPLRAENARLREALDQVRHWLATDDAQGRNMRVVIDTALQHGDSNNVG